MRDDDGRAPLHQRRQRLLDQPLGLGVERTGRLVEQQDRRVLQDGARNRDALALAAGELVAALADRGIVATRHRHDEIMRGSRLRRRDDLLLRGVRPAEGNIRAHAVVEQHDILADDADLSAQARQRDMAQVLPVDLDAALVRVVEARHEREQRRFARA